MKKLLMYFVKNPVMKKHFFSLRKYKLTNTINIVVFQWSFYILLNFIFLVIEN